MTYLLVGFSLAGPKTGPDVGKASPVGLLVVVLLLIGVFVLVWSMNRHLKRLPANFGSQDPQAPPASEAPQTTQAPRTSDDPETERPAHGSGG